MRVLLRSDGNGKIGYGHVSRLNAFAEILGEEYEKIFLTNEDTNLSIINKSLEIRLLPERLSIEDEVKWMAENYNFKDNIIIADGYQFTSKYQKLIKKKGFKLIYIDDMVSSHMYADCVINHAIGVNERQYSGESYVSYFLGPKYSLLRGSFIKMAQLITKKEIIFQTAFVSFGGTDSSVIITNAVKALLKFENFKRINIVVGKSFNDLEMMKFFKKNKRIKLLVDINEETMSEIMKNSDFAFVPSSTISYELASARCTIASGYTTLNQFRIYEGLRKKNVVFEMGDLSNFEESDFQFQIEKILSTSVNEVQDKIKSQIKLFDGKQKHRLINIIKFVTREN